MTGLAERLAALSPEKRALLERRLMAHSRADDDAILAVKGRGPVPLSFSQQRLWFLDQLEPGSPTYNAVVAVRAEGPVDVARLARALDIVVARHEILHTVVRLEGEEPQQVVLDQWHVDVESVDLRDEPPETRETTAAELVRTLARRAYDLAHDLTVRLVVVRLDEESWAIAFLEHHIAFDGWSDDILFKEIVEIYRADAEGRPASLPELPVQYADFSLWQRRRSQGRGWDHHLDYWRAKLQGVPGVLELPTDLPRPAAQTFVGVHRRLSWPQATGAALLRTATEAGCTAYMVVVSLLSASLYRWTGADDFVLGSPFANRERPEVEGLIGFFSNTLPLRCQFNPGEGFADLVALTKETVLGAFDHQDLPFEMIVDAVGAERRPGYNPLFQVNVRASSAPAPLLELPGTKSRPLEVDVGFSRFDMAVDLTVGREVTGYLEYNSNLFSSARAQEFVNGFSNLVVDALARPDVPLWDLAWVDGGASVAGARRPNRVTRRP